MPLHRGAPRAPKVRWALRWLERKRLKAEILRGIQLMHLCLMLDAFNPILATAVLEAKDLPPLVMFSLLFPCVGKLKIAGIMQAVSRALESYYQRRQLGAANSGGCLSGGRKRKPPPTLHDWSDDMCRALTRFTTHEVWQLLEQFDMLRPGTGSNLPGHIAGGARGPRGGIRKHGVTRTGTRIGRATLGSSKREEQNTWSRTF